MKKLPIILTALRLTLGLALGAGPACAQSFGPSHGNVFASSHKGDAAPAGRTAINSRALRAYASEVQDPFGPNSPNATGGGSLGYNEMLLTY